MRHIGIALLCGALLLPAFASAAAPAKPANVQIDRIRVHFLYETTGALSEDVMPPSQFSIWNTIIGEGSAREPASDVMVAVVLKSAQDEVNLDKPLLVTVRGDKGKVLAKRSFEGLFLKHGKVVRFVMVPEAACAGGITIDATLGTQKKTAKIDMACGE